MAVKSLDEVITELHRIFADDHVNVELVTDLLQAYKSNPADWRKFAKFDTHRYTRNLVDAGNGKFNLMLLCWGESMGSSIHDHTNAHCFVKILSGTLTETRFAWPKPDEEGMPLEKIKSTTCQTNDVTYMSDELGLHRVENLSHTEPAVSLHLYIPAYDECLTFDERSGKSRKVQITFWSQYGERTKYQIPCSAVDPTEVTN